MKRMFLGVVFAVLSAVSSYGATYNVQDGWNLLGAPCNIPVSAFNKEGVVTVWRWTGCKWEVYSPNEKIKELIDAYGLPTFDEINALEGFWVNARGDFTVEVNECETLGSENSTEDVVSQLKQYKWVDIVVQGRRFYGLGLKKYSDSTWTRPDGREYYDWGVWLVYFDLSKCNVKKIYLNHYITEDNNNGKIHLESPNSVEVFHTKSDQYMYAMTGYIYHVNLETQEVTKDTLFEEANWGWFPLFDENGRVWHFSFAGYYEMVDTETVGKADPADMAEQYHEVQSEYSAGIINSSGEVNIEQVKNLLSCSQGNNE